MRRAILYCVLAVVLLSFIAVQSADKVLIAQYNYGDKFYVDLGSFEPGANGELFYRVIGDNRYLYTETVNQVDCKTGYFKSYLHIKKYDRQDKTTEERSMNPIPIRLNKGTALYGVLKSACMENHLASGSW